jgi:hypothetical protein
MPNPFLRLLHPRAFLARASRILSVGAIVAVASVAAHAQALPPGVHLGMTAQELQAGVIELILQIGALRAGNSLCPKDLRTSTFCAGTAFVRP